MGAFRRNRLANKRSWSLFLASMSWCERRIQRLWILNRNLRDCPILLTIHDNRAEDTFSRFFRSGFGLFQPAFVQGEKWRTTDVVPNGATCMQVVPEWHSGGQGFEP